MDAVSAHSIVEQEPDVGPGRVRQWFAGYSETRSLNVMARARQWSHRVRTVAESVGSDSWQQMEGEVFGDRLAHN